MGRVEGIAQDRNRPAAQRRRGSAAERWFVGGLAVAAAAGAVFVASGMQPTGGVEPQPVKEHSSQSGDALGPSERSLDQIAFENRAEGAAALYVFLVASADVQSFEAMLDSEAVVRDLAGDPPRRQLVLAEDSAVAAGWRGEAQFVEGQDVRRIEVQAGVR